MFLDSLPRRNNSSRINWKDSEGHKLKFIYDEISGEVEILKYSKGKLKVKYDGNEMEMFYGHLSSGKIGALIGKYSKEYRYDIDDIVENIRSGRLKILEQIIFKFGLHNE